MKSKTIQYLMMFAMSVSVALACGTGNIVTVGDNAGSVSACQPYGSPAQYPTASCSYETYSPEKKTCGAANGETGKTCSTETQKTKITVSHKDGTCDGAGSCGNGHTGSASDTSIEVNQAFLSTCGG